MTSTVFAVLGTEGTGVSSLSLALVWHRVVHNALLVLPGNEGLPNDLRDEPSDASMPLSEVLQSRACELFSTLPEAQQAVDWQFQDLPQTITPIASQKDESPLPTGEEPQWICLGDNFLSVLTSNTTTANALACFQFGFRRLLDQYDSVVWDKPDSQALWALSARTEEKRNHRQARKDSSKSHARHNAALIQPIWVVSPKTDWDTMSLMCQLTNTTTKQTLRTKQPVVILNQWADDAPLPEQLNQWIEEGLCRLVARVPNISSELPSQSPSDMMAESLWYERLSAVPHRLGFSPVAP